MFTGIIEEMGVVSRRSGPDVAILARKVLDGIREGDSIAVNGVCLTAVAFSDKDFVVQISPETLSRTTLSALRVGDAVNLERAMAADGRFGGHFVQGHVDGVGKVASVHPQGEFSLWRFRVEATVARYLVPKGSVAVDGISLTVVEPAGDTFGVAVIPATMECTTLGNRQAGDAVNIEADMVGKHIYHYLNRGKGSGLSRELLSRHGFA